MNMNWYQYLTFWMIFILPINILLPEFCFMSLILLITSNYLSFKTGYSFELHDHITRATGPTVGYCSGKGASTAGGKEEPADN